MDKNTIIGFLLIGVVLVVFTWLNRPTPEQIEAQRRIQDSIARVEYAKQLDEQKKLNQEIEAEAELANLPDSVRMARLQNSFGVFAQAMTGEDGFTVLENDLLEVHLSNKGGRVSYVRLKEYDNYKGEPLVLFNENDSKFDLTLVTASNRVVNTGDLYFTPVKDDLYLAAGQLYVAIYDSGDRVERRSFAKHDLVGFVLATENCSAGKRTPL